jgi:hypothetical protein
VCQANKLASLVDRNISWNKARFCGSNLPHLDPMKQILWQFQILQGLIEYGLVLVVGGHHLLQPTDVLAVAQHASVEPSLVVILVVFMKL